MTGRDERAAKCFEEEKTCLQYAKLCTKFPKLYAPECRDPEVWREKARRARLLGQNILDHG